MQDYTANEQSKQRRAGIFCQSVKSFIDRHKLLRPESKSPVWVGFSGGADSLALLMVLKQLGISVHAIHFHHKLRGPAADADASWCKDFCRRQVIPFSLIWLDTPGCRQSGESMEQAARRLRLEKWREIVGPGQLVGLAHHQDDDLENLLLRLSRGSNTSGLTGLRPYRVIDGIQLIRPLLAIRRRQIETFLTDLGLTEWRYDQSNEHTEIQRNAVRQRWLPEINRTLGSDSGLVRSLQALRDDADYLERAADDEVGNYPVPRLSRLRRLHPALLPRVMRLYLSRRLARDIVIRHQAIERLRQALSADLLPAPVNLPLGHGLELQLARDQLQIIEPGTSWPALDWDWRSTPRLRINQGEWEIEARVITAKAIARSTAEPEHTVHFPVRQLPRLITVRRRQPGDRMIPFSHHTPVKLKKIFNQALIPPRVRDRVPLLLANQVIIWVAGVKRASFARLPTDSAPDLSVVEFKLKKSALSKSWQGSI